MGTTKRIIIVAGGDLPESILKIVTPKDFVIGVDRGALWLVLRGRAPEVALGDFDSVTQSEFKQIKKCVPEVISYPKEKDYTDTELAVRYAVDRKPKEVVIYGGIGSRLDHSLATVGLLLYLLEHRIAGSMRTETNHITLLSGRRTIYKSQDYPFISVLPFTEEIVVTLQGFLYPTVKLQIKLGQSVGVSNEISGKKAKIIVHSGIALVIRSRD